MFIFSLLARGSVFVIALSPDRLVVLATIDLALPLADFAEANDTIDLADDCRVAGLVGLEEFNGAWETVGVAKM
jgi:hypothetical protein